MATVIRENSHFRIAWDAGIVALVMCSCAIVPFHCAFGLDAGGMAAAVIYAIDAIFAVDIALNLRTSYRHAGMTAKSFWNHMNLVEQNLRSRGIPNELDRNTRSSPKS